MKRILFLLVLIITSCRKDYREINVKEFSKMYVQDTLLSQERLVVFSVGNSLTDKFPRILVKKDKIYLFECECELINDSTIVSYSTSFLIDENGRFRKNGIWLYANYDKKGTFPFQSDAVYFNVDSIPNNWNQKLPTEEGIYFYEENYLKLISREQSYSKFEEKQQSGFYFIPNKGVLFDKISINELN